MKRKLLMLATVLTLTALCLVWGLPAFAQTYVATQIPGQPLAAMAAKQIITNSGLPIEKTATGETNQITRGRDAVNAYRYAHSQLYKSGWYRGVSEDHTPLLVAMVGAIEKEGYTSIWVTFELKSSDVLDKFFKASEEQNKMDGASWK